MFLTPVLVRVAPHVIVGERSSTSLERLLGARGIDEDDVPGDHTISDHVLIVGFGLAGKLVARSLGQRHALCGAGGQR